MFTEEKKNGIPYMRSTLIPAFHAFSTRYGGVSRGGFRSMNLAFRRGDDSESVLENYRRWSALFGAGTEGCCVAEQVHGNNIRLVTSADRHIPLTPVPYEADGIVTEEKGLPLFCFSADCVPVLLWDAEENAAAAVHCGWKSSVTDILKKALEAMGDLGANPENIRAALGPAIGKCCFETDRDVPEAIDRYLSGDTEGLWTLRPDGKYLVDLRLANKRRLLQLGVPEENIDVSEECTVCSHEKYWSARYCTRHGVERGNLCAGIVLSDPEHPDRNLYYPEF